MCCDRIAAGSLGAKSASCWSAGRIRSHPDKREDTRYQAAEDPYLGGFQQTSTDNARTYYGVPESQCDDIHLRRRRHPKNPGPPAESSRQLRPGLLFHYSAAFLDRQARASSPGTRNSSRRFPACNSRCRKMMLWSLELAQGRLFFPVNRENGVVRSLEAGC